jgi:predicted amidophosphoribosyltransferase
MDHRCRVLRNAILDALAILLPVECAGCSAPDRGLCPECAAELVAEPGVRAVGTVRVWTGLRYERVVRRVILALKEEGRTDVARALARPLGAAIDRALDEAAPGSELLPVPTSRAAYRRRGYDPVRLLLRRSGYGGARVLRVARASGAQKALGLAGRAANRAGSFVATHRLDGRSFVLVDDVLTSGATIAEAARAVEAAGGAVAGAATLAFTPRLFPSRDIGNAQEYGRERGVEG